MILIDNDVLFKFAACDLLTELSEFIRVPPKQAMVLPSFVYMAKKKFGNDHIIQKVKADFLDNVRVMPEVSDTHLLHSIDGLDVGERQLLAYLVENEEVSGLLTGDKRALTKIAEYSQHLDRVKTRICSPSVTVNCLESIFFGLINNYGFELINEKVTRAINDGLLEDKVLKITFGIDRQQSHAVESLQSYVRDLNKVVGFISKLSNE